MIPHSPPLIHPSFEDVIRFKSDTITSLRMKCGLVCLNVDRHWLLYHCRHQGLPVVSGHVLVSRDASLDEFDAGIRSLASPLCCSVAVTGLRAFAIHLSRKRNRLPKWRCGRTSSLSPSCGKFRPETCR